MAEHGLFGRINRRLERLNRWLSGAAVAASTEPAGGAQAVNPAGVVAVAKEIEHEVEGAETAENEQPQAPE